MTNTIANTPADPTLERSAVTIDGQSYNLCFDLEALSTAEDKFLAQGHDVNLLYALPRLTLSSVRTIFPCAVHKFQPELSFQQAQALVTFRSLYPIAAAIQDAWNKAMRQAEPADLADQQQSAEVAASANPTIAG